MGVGRRRRRIRFAVALAGVSAAVALAAPTAESVTSALIVSSSGVVAFEGRSFDGPVATFVDTSGPDTLSNYSETIDWGDGTTTAGTATGLGPTVAVTGAHTYAEEGPYTITVTVNDSDLTPAGSATNSLNVLDSPLSVPATAPSTFSASGSSATVAGTLAGFDAAIGGTDNGTTAGEQSHGFRHVGWDDVKLDGSDPSSVPISAGHVATIHSNRMTAFGVDLGGPVAVANDGFASVNPGVPGRFAAFSAPNIAAPLNSNTLELDVVAPGSVPTQPQATRGIGVVFLNVTQPGTSIAYLNGGEELARVAVPVAATGQVSFVGELFSAPVVTRVLITLGNARIFSFDGTTATSGPADGAAGLNLVAIDDVAMAEPAPMDPNISATAGTQFSGAVATFTDPDPGANVHDYVANVEWGDGVHTPGVVSSGPSGQFIVGGTHTYAQSGRFKVIVTVTDLGGQAHTSRFIASVAPRSTATRVSCAPGSLAVSRPSACTATVSDTAAGRASAPTGTVGFSSATSGGGFAGGVSCTLAATKLPGRSSCTATYTPGRVGSGRHRISAAYSGDGAHGASAGSTTLAVRAQGCSLRVPAPRLSGHAPRLRVTIKCDTRSSVRLSILAVIARKGARAGGTLMFASTGRGFVVVNRSATFVVKPSANTLATLRTAAKHHQRISLRLTLAAVHASTSTTRLTVGLLKIS